MHAALRFIKQKKNVRVIVAAAIFALMFANLASHAVLTVHGADERPSWSLCGGAHEVPSADCPHKRDPFGPNQAYSDDASHQLILFEEPAIAFRALTYSSPASFDYISGAVSRSPEPPFNPPKQS